METSADILAQAPRIQSIQIGVSKYYSYYFHVLTPGSVFVEPEDVYSKTTSKTK